MRSLNVSAIDENLLREVLSLSPDQRNALIDKLIESLNLPIDPEIDALWAEEAERRVAEARENPALLIPGEKVFDDINRRLKK